MLPSFEITQYR